MYIKNKEVYKIYTLKLARKLCDRGFKVLGTIPNGKRPWLNTYLFEDTEELRELVKQLKF